MVMVILWLYNTSIYCRFTLFTFHSVQLTNKIQIHSSRYCRITILYLLFSLWYYRNVHLPPSQKFSVYDNVYDIYDIYMIFMIFIIRIFIIRIFIIFIIRIWYLWYLWYVYDTYMIFTFHSVQLTNKIQIHSPRYCRITILYLLFSLWYYRNVHLPPSQKFSVYDTYMIFTFHSVQLTNKIQIHSSRYCRITILYLLFILWYYRNVHLPPSQKFSVYDSLVYRDLESLKATCWGWCGRTNYQPSILASAGFLSFLKSLLNLFKHFFKILCLHEHFFW